MRHRDPVLRRIERPFYDNRELPGQPSTDRGTDAVYRIRDLGHKTTEHCVSAGVLQHDAVLLRTTTNQRRPEPESRPRPAQVLPEHHAHQTRNQQLPLLLCRTLRTRPRSHQPRRPQRRRPQGPRTDEPAARLPPATALPWTRPRTASALHGPSSWTGIRIRIRRNAALQRRWRNGPIAIAIIIVIIIGPGRGVLRHAGGHDARVPAQQPGRAGAHSAERRLIIIVTEPLRVVAGRCCEPRTDVCAASIIIATASDDDEYAQHRPE